MKKLFYLMSLCALAFVSCQKAELEEVNASEGKYTYTLVGTASPDAKASVGDKEGNKWPMLWEAGDKLGVYSADGATLIGVAEIAAEDAGKNVATFTLTTDTELTNGQALSIVYPYVEGVSPVIKTKQTIAAANSSAGVGANAMATATATFAGSETTFALTYSNAYLRFVLNSTEFKDYTLNGITLWAAGADLSGESAAVADYVKVTVDEPAVLGTGNVELWMTARPADLSDKKVYAIVHMSKGIETVTLPVELKGAANLPAQTVTSVALPTLAKSLAPAWYEPIETRYIAAYGDGWSYGPENTVLFLGVNKDGTSPKKVTVDLRARGNFMKVTKPAYVKLYYACDLNADSKAGFVKYDDETDAHNGTSYIDYAIGEDCTIDVTVVKLTNGSSDGHMAGMIVMDEKKKGIWGINLWTSRLSIKKQACGGEQVVTINLGAGRVASKDSWYTNGTYFQWGRPWAFTWTTKITKDYEKVTEAQTFEYTMTKPYTFFYYDKNPYDWFWGDGTAKDRSGDLDDLWGNANGEQKSGVKSIYDPCPKGYRVVSPAVLAAVEQNNTVTNGNNISYLTYGSGDTALEWSFAGAYLGSATVSESGSVSLAKSGNKNTNYLCAYWSNSNTGSNGRQMSYQPNLAEASRWSTARAKGAALPVRCMVDTENR